MVFKKILFCFLIFFLLMLLVLIKLGSFRQSAKNPTMEYYCQGAVLYAYDFNSQEFTEREDPSYSDPSSWNPPAGYDYPAYCSHRWSLKHPMGASGSIICAFQTCKRINGEYECQGGFTLDELVKNAEVGDTKGWLVRDCPTLEDLADAAACIRFGGVPQRKNMCAQTDAARDWDINNQLDCEAAGGMWIDSFSFCIIPQDLLMEIDPGNPDANCGVAGEEACATLRWLKRAAGDTIFLHTLNISPKP